MQDAQYEWGDHRVGASASASEWDQVSIRLDQRLYYAQRLCLVFDAAPKEAQIVYVMRKSLLQQYAQCQERESMTLNITWPIDSMNQSINQTIEWSMRVGTYFWVLLPETVFLKLNTILILLPE